MADGLFSSLCQSLTRNSFLLYWPPLSGALVGLAGVFCFMSITKQWFIIFILNLQTSKEPNIMHSLRSLLKVATCISFTFAAVHVPGKTNGAADALSRFNLQGFRSQAPCAKKSPVLISPQLLARLYIVI